MIIEDSLQSDKVIMGDILESDDYEMDNRETELIYQKFLENDKKKENKLELSCAKLRRSWG